MYSCLIRVSSPSSCAFRETRFDQASVVFGIGKILGRLFDGQLILLLEHGQLIGRGGTTVLQPPDFRHQSFLLLTQPGELVQERLYFVRQFTDVRAHELHTLLIDSGNALPAPGPPDC